MDQILALIFFSINWPWENHNLFWPLETIIIHNYNSMIFAHLLKVQKKGWEKDPNIYIDLVYDKVTSQISEKKNKF